MRRLEADSRTREKGWRTDMAKTYETVIGLEVHVELATKTKIFCGCSTAFGGAPNTHTCPVCTGMPGSLPVLNKQVVEYAAAVGLATNCTITRDCKFDRKNYFYPDNPQNYQISQLYLPICRDGHVDIELPDGTVKAVRIHEIHMEEDAGKLVHDDWDDVSYVDFNRSGVPLIEIVSEPDMRSAQEVIAYLEKLRLIIQYLGASDCKLQEGSMRADVNLSVREAGSETFGTRTETKNLNSFAAINIITDSKKTADIFEEATALCGKPKKVSNWLMVETMRLLKENGMDAEDISFSAANLAKLVNLTESGAVNSSVAKEVFEKIFAEDIDPDKYVEENGLKQVNDEDALRQTVEEIVAANPQSVADYKAGKEKAIGFLVGQTMKAMKGKANPEIVNKMLKEILSK